MKCILFLLFPLWGTAQLKPLKYEWRKIYGPSQFLIHSPNSPVTKISNLLAGVYWFELKVTSRNRLFTRDTMIVTVNPPVIPDTIALAGKF
jgi:hypothetical protein